MQNVEYADGQEYADTILGTMGFQAEKDPPAVS